MSRKSRLQQRVSQIRELARSSYPRLRPLNWRRNPATRAGGMEPVWVLATRRHPEGDVTTAAEAAATTAADSAGSGVDATLATDAWAVVGVLEGVVKPSTSASGAPSTSTAAGPEASKVVSSPPVPLSSSIATGIEASVPGVAVLEAFGVLGKDAVDAVDESGDIGSRGISENGRVEPLGTDANDNASPPTDTAIPETVGDYTGVDVAGCGGGTLCGGLLRLAAEDLAC
ncbi:unnamed protein product [Phytophthora fragariaefolia]|uniref:Unnamed protein product n=1 Tax=Phytophthora fragariaefolia TaxID=1490495 RepID=A0A9W6X8K2_9STRA|nr:unnamed protein product [Phytophthora fragariaefolia]